MGCKCARRSDQYHGWECTVTDGECAFLVPNSNLCAEIYGGARCRYSKKLIELIRKGTSGGR